MNIFTSQRGEPITQQMLDAAQQAASENGVEVTAE